MGLDSIRKTSHSQHHLVTPSSRSMDSLCKLSYTTESTHSMKTLDHDIHCSRAFTWRSFGCPLPPPIQEDVVWVNHSRREDPLLYLVTGQEEQCASLAFPTRMVNDTEVIYSILSSDGIGNNIRISLLISHQLGSRVAYWEISKSPRRWGLVWVWNHRKPCIPKVP